MIGQEEIELVSGLFSFLSENPIIFDVGSNKGDWADIIIKEYDSFTSLYLFEPNTKLLSYTEIRFEYNKNIIFNQVALSDYYGREMFYYFENYNNELSSLYLQDWWKEELPLKEKIVDVTTIDLYCKEKNIECIDYLKIDVEGSEYDVIDGQSKCLKMIK